MLLIAYSIQLPDWIQALFLPYNSTSSISTLSYLKMCSLSNTVSNQYSHSIFWWKLFRGAAEHFYPQNWTKLMIKILWKGFIDFIHKMWNIKNLWTWLSSSYHFSSYSFRATWIADRMIAKFIYLREKEFPYRHFLNDFFFHERTDKILYSTNMITYDCDKTKIVIW